MALRWPEQVGGVLAGEVTRGSRLLMARVLVAPDVGMVRMARVWGAPGVKQGRHICRVTHKTTEPTVGRNEPLLCAAKCVLLQSIDGGD